MYLFILAALNRAGFKKFAVRLAYLMEDFSTIGNRMCDAAQIYLYGNATGFPTCSECYLPILSDSDNMHSFCFVELQRIAEEEEAAWQEFAAEQEALLADRAEEDRIAAEEVVAWLAFQYEQDAAATFGDEDDGIGDEICDGICGQPAYACTCAETMAYRRQQADPETRGSWFVA